MGEVDVLQQRATAGASARGAYVQVTLKFALSGLNLWRQPMVVAMTPDDAMALSIQLQKAVIDARLCEYRHTS
jgi:hypothetical protein